MLRELFGAFRAFVDDLSSRARRLSSAVEGVHPQGSGRWKPTTGDRKRHRTHGTDQFPNQRSFGDPQKTFFQMQSESEISEERE